VVRPGEQSCAYLCAEQSAVDGRRRRVTAATSETAVGDLRGPRPLTAVGFGAADQVRRGRRGWPVARFDRSGGVLMVARTPVPAIPAWAADGTGARLKAQVITLAELDDDIDGNAQIDATAARTHQHPAGAADRG
jgi:hypothetical protein